MGITLSVHDPSKAIAETFPYGGQMCGGVELYCGDNPQSIIIYTAPEKAEAIAAIINEKGTT